MRSWYKISWCHLLLSGGEEPVRGWPGRDAAGVHQVRPLLQQEGLRPAAPTGGQAAQGLHPYHCSGGTTVGGGGVIPPPFRSGSPKDFVNWIKTLRWLHHVNCTVYSMYEKKPTTWTALYSEGNVGTVLFLPDNIPLYWYKAVLRIRILPFGPPGSGSYSQMSGSDPAPDPDPSIIKQK